MTAVVGRIDARVFRLDEPARDLLRVFGRGPGGPSQAELIAGGEADAAARDLGHGGLAGKDQVDGTLRLAHGYLEHPTDHQSRIVLALHAMVHLGVLPNDLALVARLLIPLDGVVASPGLGAWVC